MAGAPNNLSRIPSPAGGRSGVARNAPRRGSAPGLGDSSARRAAVLILVVALLGILFVAGAALLSSVTFATKTLNTERADRENRAAVEAVEQMVGGLLRNGFLGPDGNPYNAPTTQVMHLAGDVAAPCDAASALPCVLTLPAYAEVPGVQTWVDLTEPQEETPATTSPVTYKLYSSFASALDGRPGDYPGKPAAGVGVLRANSGGAPVDVNADGYLDPPQDADGDGVVDTFELIVPATVLSADLRRAVAERLRAPSYAVSAGNPDQLRLSLRIVPHGAMANLNQSHEFLVKKVVLDNILAGLPLNPPYLPEANEWLLRNRGVLPPRELPAVRLLADVGEELLRPHQVGTIATAAQLLDPAYRRWWQYDPVADTQEKNDAWRVLMNPAYHVTGRYDVMHNLTTVSYDDLLIRGRSDPTTGKDVIDLIKELDGNSAGAQTYAVTDKFAWDNYPYRLDGTGDPRLGRVKLSLPYMDTVLGSGKTIDGLTSGVVSTTDRQRFVRTIQEAFLLMLSNAASDFNGDGVVNATDGRQIAVQAAMLTANLIDFADGDSTGEPLRVDVISAGTNGAPVPGADGTTPLAVYGFERQPFITEVYAKVDDVAPLDNKVDQPTSAYAVELYNPYNSQLDLSYYELNDQMAFDTAAPLLPPGVIGSPLPRLKNLALSGTIPGDSTIPLDDPRRFYVVTGYGQGMISAADLQERNFGLDDRSVVVLVRKVGTAKVVVDEFRCAGSTVRDAAAGLGLFGAMPPPASDLSIQRDTTVGAWRFVVPKATKVPGASSQTVGAANSTQTVTVDATIYPVHVDTRNSATFKSAYPTTGSLLLLTRMAHVYDGSSSGSWTSPFNALSKQVAPWALVDDYNRIDNGRMPVFDAGRRYHSLKVVPTEADPPQGRLGFVQGTDALPWGQLVFDYFTALPLDACAPDDYICDPDGCYPCVDQDGLRVQGRIDINAAPWKVLAGLPMVRIDRFAPGFETELTDALGIGASTQTILGDDAAQAIVAYRDARRMQSSTADYRVARDPRGARSTSSPLLFREGYGFLTPGELLNVRHPDESDDNFRMDRGACSANPASTNATEAKKANYIRAVARMVTLGDWVTTRSHVFTIYGTIRGAHDPTSAASKAEANQRALRFQTTVNRLPMFFGATSPELIGSRTISEYADVRSE